MKLTLQLLTSIVFAGNAVVFLIACDNLLAGFANAFFAGTYFYAACQSLLGGKEL